MMPEYSLLFVLGAILSLSLTPLSRRIALRVGAIDHPSDRRVHVVATPRLGGPAILIASAVALFLTKMLSRSSAAMLYAEWRSLAVLALGALMITAVGIIDDIRAVRPRTKLLVETLAACVAVCGGYRIELPVDWGLAQLSFPLSVLFIASTVNAVNLIDGLDGLAAGLGAIITLTLVLLCPSGGRIALSLVLAAFCGATAAFLRYNVHPARIFLGDSGALLLGFIVALGTLSTSQYVGGFARLAPFLVLGLPLMELSVTLARRVLREVRMVSSHTGSYQVVLVRRPALFTADRDHIHHRLLRLGIGHRDAVLLLYGVEAAFCAVSVASARFDRFIAGPLLVGLAVASLVCLRALGYRELTLKPHPLAFPPTSFASSFESRRTAEALAAEVDIERPRNLDIPAR